MDSDPDLWERSPHTKHTSRALESLPRKWQFDGLNHTYHCMHDVHFFRKYKNFTCLNKSTSSQGVLSASVKRGSKHIGVTPRDSSSTPGDHREHRLPG